MKAKLIFRPVLVWALAIILVAISFPVGPAARMVYAEDAGTTYYVDSAEGNDSNSGLSDDTPWKTLGKVTASHALFQPGDRILLKSGSVWNEPFDITFSGAEGNVINVGKYGGEAKPLINGGGNQYAVRIQNQQYVTVQDLELTNFNADNYDDYKSAFYRRSGVWLQAFHNGPLSGITLRGLDIHDVTGISITGETWVQSTDNEWVNKNFNAGIMINSWEWENVTDDKHAYYKNLTVENNYIHDIKTIGVYMDGIANDVEKYHKNVIVRGNTISKTGADGIIIGVADNPLVEHNVVYDAAINSVDGKWIAGIWFWKCDGATVQYNEVARVHYQNSSNTDSNAFDVDIYARGNHVFQYNYTHDNAGGFAMDMGHLQDGISTYRYNISQNDAHHGFTGMTMNISDPSIYYNNVFYNDNGDGFKIKDNAKATFINNIFYTSKGNTPFPVSPKFYNNAFSGSAPPSQGVNNLVVDPKFIDPGKGVNGIGSVAGFQLRADSPLIGAGKRIDSNGGLDFWGNPLYAGSPDVGAFEAPGSAIPDTTAPIKPTGVAVVDKTDTTVTLAWSAEENGVPLDGEVYDASNDEKVASVLMSNTAMLTGLAPDTEYDFYVIAKDLSGNASEPSEEISVRTTIPEIVIDDSAATLTGAWAEGTGDGANNGGFHSIAKGSGLNSVTWTPNLPLSGYYSVYYRLPNGSSSRASNAPFTVQFDGGAKTYAVNERGAGGAWVLLGIHKFAAGTSGSVTVTDNANGEVAADAVKFLYNVGFGLGSVNRVLLTAEKLQLRIGESMALSVKGVDAAGKALDLLSEGFEAAFSSDNPTAATISETGVITGVGQGTVNVTATVTINGSAYTSNIAKVIVGPGFGVQTPEVTDINGNELASFSPYGLVKASTSAVNSTDSQKNVTLIVAVYDKKGLVKSSMESVNIPSYENAEVNAVVVMPENVQGCYLKVFVWDGKDAMHPLAARTLYR